MTRRNVRIFTTLAIALVLLLWLAWFVSPYWAVRQMGQAARANDAQAFNDYVDYPRLRENLKAQLAARIGAGGELDADNPLARLGQALGNAMVGGAVDALVRPETVMLAMRSGVVQAPGHPRPEEPPAQPPEEPAPRPAGLAKQPGPRWHYDRQGLSRVLVYRSEPAGAPRGTVFVLEREHLLGWKLAGLVLPQAR